MTTRRPTATRRRSGPPLSRRHLLAGATLVTATTAVGIGLGGCAASPLPLLTPDPDDEVRATVAASELQLIAAYTAAIAAVPALGTRLRPLLDQHSQHLTAVSDGLDLPSEAPSVSAPPAAQNGAAAVRALRRLEAAAARQRTDACVAAADDDLAVLLGRIAASESGHVAALQAGAS